MNTNSNSNMTRLPLVDDQELNLQILKTYFQNKDKSFNSRKILAEYQTGIVKKCQTESSREIWKNAIRLDYDMFLGLKAGRFFSERSVGHILQCIAANSFTIGAALSNICKYHDMCSLADYPLEFTNKNHCKTIEIAPHKRQPDELDRHIIECAFSGIVTALSSLYSEPIFPFIVNFPWPQTGGNKLYERIFGENIVFRARFASITYTNDVLNKKIPFSNAILLEHLTALADQHISPNSGREWTRKVKSLLYRYNDFSSPEITQIANTLCISARVLQTNLKSEGTNYKTILRESRIHVAKKYLNDKTLTIADIAHRLGYSEQSSFNHAFKSWTNMTPKQYRGLSTL